MRRLNVVVRATAAVAGMVAVAVFVAMMSRATPANAADRCTSSYGSVQAAINAASDGDTIQVVYGTHYETLVITEDITLEGGWFKGCGSRTYTDPQYTTIDGGALDHVVEITNSSTAMLDGLTLTNGESVEGGGVYVSGAYPSLNNVVVTDNSVTSSTVRTSGAGVYVENGTITMAECEISYNTGEGSQSCDGGGLALHGWYAGAVLEATQIVSNSYGGAGSLYGGGLWLDAGAEVTFDGTGNIIAYNEATYGAGVYAWPNMDLQNIVIRDNHASYSGGGVSISTGFTGGRMANNFILRNTADVYADSVFANNADMEVANNTIVGDSSSSVAGVFISGGGGGLKLTNNIVVGHAVGIERSGGASVTLANNDVWGNTADYVGLPAGSGAISADPEFVDPDNGDYHLTADSPCINAGAYVEGLLFDYEGDRRTGTLLDVGADEYGSDYLLFIPAALNRYTP